MPILTCTKCAAGLRVPDGATGAARCPRCKALIPVEGGVVCGTNEATPLPQSPPPPPPPSDGIPNLALDLALPPPPPAPKLVPPPKPVVTAKAVSPPKPPTAVAPALKRTGEPPAKPAAVRPPAPPPPPPAKKPAFEVVGETMEPLPLDDLPPLPPIRGRADVPPRRDDGYDRPPRRDDRDDDRRPRRDDYEDDYDRPRRRDDDDYDDRPRPRRRDEDDYDDRPRRGRRDDEYDDYEDDYDRPRRGRGRYEDDYDDYDDRRPSRGRSDGMGAAKVGTLLVSISLWIYLGIYGVGSFIVLLFVMETRSSALDVLGTIAGIVGLGNWTVALVGVGFLIAGPAKYGLRGLSIATAIVGGIHLILVILTACGVTGTRSRGGIGFADELHGDLKAAATLVPLLDLFPTLLYISTKTQGAFGELFSHLIIPLLAAMCEVARFILLMLVMKAAARTGKDSGAASKSQVSVVIYSAVNGVIPIVLLLIAVIMGETRSSGRGGGGSGGETVAKIMVVLIALAHTCALIMPGVAANEARAAVARRAR